jgi:TolB protein
MSPVWSPDGTRIYFVRAASSVDLWVVNADGTGATPLGVKVGTPQQPALSPDGRQLAFVASVNNATTIMIADANGANVRALTTPPPGGDQSPDWSPDGRRIVFERIENGAGQLYVMMADGTGVTKLSSVPKSEGPARWSPAF